MNRRGFLASLVALVVAPRLPARPCGTGLGANTAQVDALLKEAYSHASIEQLHARNLAFLRGCQWTVTEAPPDVHFERVR